MDDCSLIQAIRDGDIELYETLMDRYLPTVYGLCYRMTHDKFQAEELAHDAFVEAYLKLDQLRNPVKFSGWVRQIALNLCRMWYRKNTHLHEELSEETLAADDAETDSDIHAHMALGFSSLAVIHRLVLVLHYFERLSYEEIAEFLDIPVGTVMSRLHRARNALKNSVKEIADDKENEALSMKMEEHFQRGVQAEIAVLIKMFQEQPGAMERLSLILERSPERLAQLIRQTDDEGILNNLAVIVPRLGIRAIEQVLELYFLSEVPGSANAQEILFNIIQGSQSQGTHRLGQMAATDVYMLLDKLIQFPADRQPKVEFIMELMEICEDRCTGVLLMNCLLCYPGEAFAILMDRFKATVDSDSHELSLSLAGIEGMGRSLEYASRKEYVSRIHVLNDIRTCQGWFPLLKEDLNIDLYNQMVKRIAMLLEHPAVDVRDKALRILGLLKAEEYVESISTCMSHAALSTRLVALRALADIGNAECAELLAEAVQKGSVVERCAAIEAMGRLQVQDSQPLLKRLIDDPDERIQKAAVTALGEIGGESVRLFLEDLLHSEHIKLRRIVAKALYRGDPRKKVIIPESTRKRLHMVRGNVRPFILSSMDAVIRYAIPEIRKYDERELTRRIAGICFDYSTTRRDLMDEGLMTRSNGICELTEKGKTVWRVEHYIMDH